MTEQAADRRHHQVLHQRGHNLSEGYTIITPTAKSTIFPRMANALNSLSTVFLLCSFDEGKTTARADSQTLLGMSVAGIIVKAEEKERREDGRAWDLPRAPRKDPSLARPEDQERPNHAAQYEQATAD